MLSRRYPTSSWYEEMERLQNEMNRLFNTSLPARSLSSPAFPAMNVWTSSDGALVTAELPGVQKEDIEITVVGQTLSLKGSRKVEELKEGYQYHRQERGYGNFTRSIELPFPVDAEKVEAVFDKGVLEITLPRSEADKPKKIVVKSS